ncbi:phage tail assembly chaperone [Cupriavidus basilensis]
MIVAYADGNPEVVDRPDPTAADLATTTRTVRDKMLRATDWTQLPDVPTATRDRFLVYRQALRDVSTQPGLPHTVNFPSSPAR